MVDKDSLNHGALESYGLASLVTNQTETWKDNRIT